MRVYDPELNPGKTLEETIQNFINWIRMSNRNTANVLKSVNEKLQDISKTEENLKTLETSQLAGLDKIDKMLTSISQITQQNNSQDEATDSNREMQLAINSLTSQMKDITGFITNFQENMESEFTQGMNKIEGAILDVKSDISLINSQLKIPLATNESSGGVEKNIKQELTKIRKQIICKTEQDKASVLTIIDTLIEELSREILEISGLDLKKRLIKARTQVYEQTEGLAPRFRKMMDNHMEAINDETLYSAVALAPLLIEGIRHIREIYASAPVGQIEI
ncbi:hypothetical protein CEE45_15545 [Candidatus Heimdallarchaeota archaeon B3_Heim]|nr:MAG: hypothetical protein CEE45_15545 [Candidatus Heimdallarchaeota archaeon B3_Heim]